jgi:hypothetical protein
MIVYRNLDPVDERLPGLKEVRKSVSIPADKIPRKGNPDYAEVVVYLIQKIVELDDTTHPIRELIFLGDTQLNDGNAFLTICKAGNWPGLAFIASENEHPATLDVVDHNNRSIYLANRWYALKDFEELCLARGFQMGKGTAVIVDLDKTALGARGRNDQVINQARVDAVRQTVGSLLGEAFNLEGFQQAYDHLNQEEFHSFTTDNQDYLAYTCLILGSDLYSLESLLNMLSAGEINSFDQFLTRINAQAAELPTPLKDVHNNFYTLFQSGDPTPFKAFRYQEYITTTARMGTSLEENVDQLLQNKLVITREVQDAALRWKNDGALLLGLSDKPDEACFPEEELAGRGHLPLHRTETHVVGE